MNPLAWHKAIVDLIKYTPSPPPFWPMHQSDISKEGYYQVKQWTCRPSTKENFNYSPCWVTLPPTCIFSTVANFIFKRISILGFLNFQWNLCLSLIIYNFPWLSKYLKNVTLKLKKFTWTTSLQIETTKR